MAFKCTQCGFALWHLIWDGPYTAVALFDDDRFPGRSLIALKLHWEHFDEFPEGQLATLNDMMVRLGAALRSRLGASRVNYAVLGNSAPHVHAHVVPRFSSQEPAPRRAPWEDPRNRGSLGQRIPDLISILEGELAS